MRYAMILAIGLLAAGCHRNQQQLSDNLSGSQQKDQSFAINKDADVLLARAQAYWTAREGEDWATRYQYEAKEVRDKGSVEEFVRWCDENEPFVVHRFEILSAETQDDMGWVQMRRTLAPRKIPMAAQTRGAWDLWRKEQDGNWYKISSKELANVQFPLPPSRRDLAEENQLLARFQEVWEARRDGDWADVYDMLDPRDLEGKSKEDFIKMYSATKFLNRKIKWVQVTGGRGKTQAIYQVKVNDPNVRNIEPTFQLATELWVKYDGKWYLEVEKQVAGR